MKNKKILNKIKLLILSFLPIFLGPILIHLGGQNNSYLKIFFGIFLCVIAVILIFISLFGIINEIFKK